MRHSGMKEFSYQLGKVFIKVTWVFVKIKSLQTFGKK